MHQQFYQGDTMLASEKNCSSEAPQAVLSKLETVTEENVGINEKMIDGILHFQAYAKVNGLDFYGAWTPKRYKAIREREYYVGLRLPRLTKNRYTANNNDIYMGIAILTYINEKHSYKSNTKRSYLKAYKAWDKFHTISVNDLQKKLKQIQKYLQKIKKQKTAILQISILKTSIKHMVDRHGLSLTFDLKLFEKDLYDAIKTLPLGTTEVISLSKKEFKQFFETLEKASKGEIILNYSYQEGPFSIEVLKEALDLCKIIVSIGDRPGETLALTPDDINFNQQEISITKTWTEDGIQPIPKSHASNRTIPIPNSLADILKKRCEEASKKEPVLNNGNHLKLLFSFHRSLYQNVFSSIRTLLGFKKNVTLYKLKHTFGTFFMKRYSNDPRVIDYCAYIMGHSTKEKDHKYEKVTKKYLDLGNEWKGMLTVFDVFKFANTPDIDQDTFVSCLNDRGFNGNEIFQLLREIKDNFGLVLNDIDVYLKRISRPDIVFFYTKISSTKSGDSTDLAA